MSCVVHRSFRAPIDVPEIETSHSRIGRTPDNRREATCNYYPRERDGRIDAIEKGLTESERGGRQIRRPIVKAFNAIYWKHPSESGKPKGTAGRVAIPAANDGAPKITVLDLVEELGFDVIDAGPLNQSWRQQPGTPVYGADLPEKDARRALADAKPERTAEFRATANSPGSFQSPA